MNTRFPNTVSRPWVEPTFTVAPKSDTNTPIHFLQKDVSPWTEMGAYEWLWLNKVVSYEDMANIFRRAPALLPSDLVPDDVARATSKAAFSQLGRAGVSNFGVRVQGTCEYPSRLNDASHPPPVLYYQG